MARASRPKPLLALFILTNTGLCVSIPFLSFFTRHLVSTAVRCLAVRWWCQLICIERLVVTVCTVSGCHWGTPVTATGVIVVSTCFTSRYRVISCVNIEKVMVIYYLRSYKIESETCTSCTYCVLFLRVSIKERHKPCNQHGQNKASKSKTKVSGMFFFVTYECINRGRFHDGRV